MGAGKQTVGFRYYFSLHMGLGRGPVNEIVDITVGDVSAMGDDDPICIGETGQLYLITKPNLFGGDKKEGGINGPIFFYNGARDQELEPATVTSVGTLPAIETALGGDVPNFRGVVTAWFDGQVCALNPYPKPWAFRVRRTTAGWYDNACWYPQKATIFMESEEGKSIYGMNGAHMLYEVNTNPEWGRGMPLDLIDENSFIYAADQLCSEGFGLCIPWFRQEPLKDFIPIIINLIGGVQYVDRTTGKLTLRLIRNDYDPDDLPVFGPDSGLLRLEDDDSSGEETAFNEIKIVGFDPTRKEDISLVLHNLASIQSLGEIISNTVEYKGIPTRDLLARVGQREMRAQTGQRRLTGYFDRRAFKIAPGMPFKITYPGKGIESMIVRAGEISDGGLLNGEIAIKMVEDLFGQPDTSYITPTPPVWSPPDFTAAPATAERLIELGWRDFYALSTSGERDAVDENTSYIATMATPPVGVASSTYDLETKAVGESYVVQNTGSYTAAVTLAADLLPLDTTGTLNLTGATEFLAEFVDGMVVLIDNEQIAVGALDVGTGAMTGLKRGMADTIPDDHLAAAIVWLEDDDLVGDGREYVSGETVNAKVLPRTSTDVLDDSDAAELTIVVNQRLFRPYPPGDVQIDGVSIYTPVGEHPEPVLTLAHRDRLIQADTEVGHTEASIGPEAGVTYILRVYSSDEVTLYRTEPFSGDTFTYDASMVTADGNPTIVVMELVSVRGGIESFYAYRFPVRIQGGWDFDWDLDWSV